MKFTCIIGTSFTKLRLFFHKVSFIINKPLPPSREKLYAGDIEIFAEALELFTHVVFYLVFVVRKTASTEYILQGANKMEVGWY
jgi:peptide subunit release factor 1 (eRF1)